MICRAVRLFVTGLTVACATGAATLAMAGDVTADQHRTIAIPKRVDLAARPASLGALTPSLSATPANRLTPPLAAAIPSPSPPAANAPLTGLSLSTLSLAAPLASDPMPPSPAGESAVTQKNGNIVYNMIPNSGFTPYIGLGAGRAAGMLGSGGSAASADDNTDSLHSYQGLAGFAYKLDKDTRLDFDYRMSNTQRPTVPVDNASMADAERDRAAILSLHYDLDPILRRPK